MRSARIALTTAALSALVAASAGMPLPASAATGTVVMSLNSTRDPQYPVGQSRFSDTGTVMTDGTGGFIASAGTWNVHIAPPQGQVIHPGVYPNVTGSTTTQYALADISVGSYDTGFGGVLDVLDWAAGSNGVPTRFDIVFRTPTGQSAQGYFGELRMGEEAAGTVALAARHLEWSPTPVGATPITAVEWLHNRSSKAVTVGAAALSGDAAQDFAITQNGCSGRSLAAGARCSLLVGFSPKKAGPRIAALSVPVGGAASTVSLAGAAPLGTNRLTTSGGDELDKGTTNTWAQGGTTFLYSYKNGCGYTVGDLSPYGLGDDSRRFEVAVGPRDTPPGPGTYAVSSDCGKRGTKPLLISESGYTLTADGSATVHHLDVDAYDVLTAVDVSFTLQGLKGTMTGRLQYQARFDYSAPKAPTGVVASGTGVRWAASASSDAVASIARLVPASAPLGTLTPTSGYPVSAGTGTSATVALPRSGTAYRLVVFAVDAAGNVSAPASVAIG